MTTKTLPPIQTIISERLTYLRQDKHITQKEIAASLNVSQSNYSRWEKCREFIPLKKLNDLCNKYHVGMDYIIGLVPIYEENGYHELTSKTIGKNIKTFRKKYHLSQRDLANKLNTTQSTISAYEAGKTTILTSFALQIVMEYNISLDWLCGRIDYENR